MGPLDIFTQHIWVFSFLHPGVRLWAAGANPR